MSVARRIVFPILWLVLTTVIAVALVKLAFFSSNAASGDALEPTGEVGMSTVIAERGSIASSTTLTGTLTRDAGTAITAPREGVINHVWVKDGDDVTVGTKLFQIRYQEEETVTTEPVTDPDTGEIIQPAGEEVRTRERYVTVSSESSGTLTAFTARVDDPVERAASLGTVSPGTFSAHADLSPQQQLQFLDTTLNAKVTIEGVGSDIECGALRVGEKEKSESDPGNEQPIDPMLDEPQQESFASLTCPIPAGTRVVPGLKAEITIDHGTVEDVIVVPTTAVLGNLADGQVFVVDPATGAPTPISVELGLRGEGYVEIKSGLEEGTEILQFAPGVPADEFGTPEFVDEGQW